MQIINVPSHHKVDEMTVWNIFTKCMDYYFLLKSNHQWRSKQTLVKREAVVYLRRLGLRLTTMDTTELLLPGGQNDKRVVGNDKREPKNESAWKRQSLSPQTQSVCILPQHCNPLQRKRWRIWKKWKLGMLCFSNWQIFCVPFNPWVWHQT